MAASSARISSFFSSAKRARCEDSEAASLALAAPWESVLANSHVYNNIDDADERVGVHSAVDSAFGNATATASMKRHMEERRSKHSRGAGRRIHACAQHATVCIPRSQAGGYSTRLTPKRRRGCRRCVVCEHPAACRAKDCREVGEALGRWLEASGLVPIMAEAPIRWHRRALETRCDMLCVTQEACATLGAPVEKLPALVIVSIKTLGVGRRVPSVKGSVDTLISIPSTVTRESIPDCEATRHQLQLMMETAILRDSYLARVVGAHIVYIGREEKGGRVLCRSVQAEQWWWDSVAESVAPPFHSIASAMERGGLCGIV